MNQMLLSMKLVSIGQKIIGIVLVNSIPFLVLKNVISLILGEVLVSEGIEIIMLVLFTLI